MNWLDYVLIFIIILNFYNGCRYGLLRQVAGLLGLFIALYAALYWSGDLKMYLQEYIKLEEVITVLSSNGEASLWLTEVILNIAAFLIIFLVLSLVFGLIAKKLSLFNKIPLVGPLNALLGGILGAFKGILLVFLIAALISLVETGFWMKAIEASAVIALSRHYMPLLFGLIFDFVVGRMGKLV